MKHPNEWNIWTLHAVGFVCGVGFVVLKMGQKYSLTEYAPKEWAIMIVVGGSLGAFLFYALRLSALVKKK